MSIEGLCCCFPWESLTVLSCYTTNRHSVCVRKKEDYIHKPVCCVCASESFPLGIRGTCLPRFYIFSVSFCVLWLSSCHTCRWEEDKLIRSSESVFKPAVGLFWCESVDECGYLVCSVSFDADKNNHRCVLTCFTRKHKYYFICICTFYYTFNILINIIEHQSKIQQ